MLTDFSPEIRAFIRENLEEKPEKITLKLAQHKAWNAVEIADQIRGFQKSRIKLPTWHAKESIRFPHRVSMEQCSSEITARYKAQLVSGQVCWDITGGFGVDDYFFAQKFGSVHSCEMQENLSQIAAYNFKVLGANNVTCHHGDGLKALESYTGPLDLVYIDPARRGDSDSRVFLLEDCQPNIIAHQEAILTRSPWLLIKTAPVLDIHEACRSLTNVAEVHIVSVHNECKEVLYLLSNQPVFKTKIKTVNLYRNKDDESFESDFATEQELAWETAAAANYLYEPNASIMKSGLFRSLGASLGIKKLHQNSHLYTSENLIENFPGRTFCIKDSSAVQKKKIAKILPSKQAHIATRNFPSTVAQMRKKLGIKEGGNDYLFLTTDQEGQHIALLCQRIES